MSNHNLLDAATEAFFSGDYPLAKTMYELLLDRGEKADQRNLVAHCKQHLGMIARLDGEDDVAEMYIEEALALFEALGDTVSLAHALDTLSGLEVDYFKRLAYHERSLGLKEALGDIAGQIRSLQALGDLAMEGGDAATADRFWRRTLR
jgi:tetratricopeptide (TPR) repeat protein